MTRLLCAMGLAALCLTFAKTGATQPVPDHLQCYKVKDPQTKAKYTADLDGLVAEPGCTIKVPAIMACVPATKTNVQPTPPGGGGMGTPNSFFCYKVKCPKVTLTTLAGTDQFGSRSVRPTTTKLLCAPLAGPTTTTITTTSSTTTTTAPRFVDNGDGTVTDHQTGLIWEKKDNSCPGIHCVTDTFSWSASGSAPDGTAFMSFLNALNGGATGVGNCESVDGNLITHGFNRHCDWRLPSIVELKTVVDLGAPGCGAGSPCIDAVFGPTAVSFYWSSTNHDPGDPSGAWGVNFNGVAVYDHKAISYSVRAVRGGS